MHPINEWLDGFYFLLKFFVSMSNYSRDYLYHSLTKLAGVLPSRASIIFWAAISAILFRVSSVAEAMWGVIITLSSSFRAGVISGSNSNTSSAAPLIHLSLRALAKAFSSTIGPREVLIR